MSYGQMKFSAYFGSILLPEINRFTSSVYVEISMYTLLLREDWYGDKNGRLGDIPSGNASDTDSLGFFSIFIQVLHT